MAGNLSSSTSVNITQDSSPPTGAPFVSVPAQEYLVSTNSIEFVFVSNQEEIGATGVVNFLSMDYIMTSTDQTRFSTSVSLSLISTELDFPDYIFSISDALSNSTSFSGSLTNKIDTIAPQFATTTPIVFGRTPISNSTYVGEGSSVNVEFHLSKLEDFVKIYHDGSEIRAFRYVYFLRQSII